MGVDPESRVRGYDLCPVSDPSTASDAPAVVAVCVTSNSGPEFDACLESLVAQDYSNLSILVVDAGSETPVAGRVASIAPEAYIHRLATDPGFSAACNQALSLVSDAPFLLFCHDDVALDAHCVSALVEELFRSNAGIVCPKFVEWDDRRRLLAVGRGSDRFGVQVDLVEPREFDQEQYDGVRDVFVAPSGAQLVRTDLFTTLGGFDPSMGGVNEDLDFCWRAHAVGARVVVVPATFVRHLLTHEAAAAREPVARARALNRNRLRTVLVTSSRLTLALTLPLMLTLMAMEALYLTLAGRRGQAGALIGAITWNASRLGEIRERRADLRALRKVSDAEVRALQVGGSARLNGFFRGQFGAGQDRLADLVGSVRSSLAGNDGSSARAGVLLGGLLALVGVFGSRDLITDGVVAVGQIPTVPSAGDLLGEWWSGWRSAGIGSEAAAPVGFFFLGVARIVFFWGEGVLDLLFVVGPLLLGAVGMWRLVAHLGSLRAAAFATLAYVVNPLPVAAMGAGRWDALVVWGILPFLVLSALRLQLAPSFAVGATARRTRPIRVLRYGLLVGFVSFFSPPIVVVAVIVPVLLVVAGVLVARPRGVASLVLGAVAAVIVPVGIQAPWSARLLSNFRWSWLVGPPSPEAGFDSLADLMRFATGSAEPGRLVLGLLIAAAVALVIARRHRFDLAVQGWVLATGSWLLVWAGRRGWLPADLPAAEVVLPIAACGLALAVGVAVRSLEVDIADRTSIRWRGAVTATALSIGAVSLLGLASSLDGRWDLPTQSFNAFTAPLSTREAGAIRVLWLADPSVLGADLARSPGGVNYMVTDGSTLDVISRYAPGEGSLDEEVGQRLDLVVAGETENLGRLLAPYGIDLIIVVPTLAPAPYTGPTFDPGGGIAPVLGQQLDIQRVAGTPNLVVYRNTESEGPAVALDDVEQLIGVTPAQQLDTDLTVGDRAPLRLDRPGRWTSTGADPGVETRPIVVSVPAEGWVARNANTDLGITNANTLVVRRIADGPIDLGFQTSSLSRLFLIGQLILIAGGVLLAQSQRERPLVAPVIELDEPVDVRPDIVEAGDVIDVGVDA